MLVLGVLGPAVIMLDVVKLLLTLMKRLQLSSVTAGCKWKLVCREDLAKPAQTLFLHNLTGILETAIRATNAQYDDADILTRLDVRLLGVGNGLPLHHGI